MKLDDYVRVFLRRKWVVIVTALVATATVAIGSALLPPTYTATARLRVVTATSGSPDFVEYDLNYTDRIMGTYVEIASSSSMRAVLRERLGVDALPAIAVEVVPDTELLAITVEDSDPALAQDTAATLSGLLVNEVPFRGVRIYVVETAALSGPPSLQERIVTLGLALAVGLVGGVGLALVWETLDPRLYSANQIAAAAELPLLGEIPAVRRVQAAALLDRDPAYAEAVLRLAANLVSMAQGRGLHTLLVVSAEPQEGKSALVAALGIAVARQGYRVVLVDADLRLSALHSLLGLDNANGLSRVLQQEASLAEALQRTEHAGLQVLTSGPAHPQPGELLGSQAMRAVLSELARCGDLIVLDSPAYLAVADAAMLAPAVDGALLVSRRGRVRRESIRAVRQQWPALGASLLGVVVNWAEAGASSRYWRYYGR